MDDQKKEPNEEEEEELTAGTDKYSAWRVLIDDILGGEIVKRLSLLDHARFRAVCKDWLAIHRNYTITIKSLPWYVQCDCQLAVVSKKLEFRLYDPLSTPNLVSTQYISLTKVGIPSPPHPYDIAFAEKNSWLLICIRRPKLFFKMRCRYFLAYSPFTKQLIKLPTFDYSSGVNFKIMFTTVPDSPSCAFCLLNTLIADKFVCVTYRNGDSGWTIREFDRVDAFVPCRCQVFFFRGIIYIVSLNGQLASYNIVDGEFRYENLVGDEIFTLNCSLYDLIYRVFELNGELMMLHLHEGEISNTSSPIKPCLKQFNWSNKVWIPVTTLGYTTLFVRHRHFRSSTVAIVKREEMTYSGILSNKIYYFFDDGCIIYSLENGELVQFKSINSSSLKDGRGEYNYIGWMQTAMKLYGFIKSPECVR